MASAAPRDAFAPAAGRARFRRPLGRHGLHRLAVSSSLYRALRRFWVERLTSRGRYLFVLCVVLGLAGLDTRRSLAYQLFAAAAGPLAVAVLWSMHRPPRVQVGGGSLARLTAGRRAELTLRVKAEGRSGPLVVAWPLDAATSAALGEPPSEVFVDSREDGPARVRLEIAPRRRGRFVVPGPVVAATDPLGLVATAPSARLATAAVHVYPPFFHIDRLALPAGRRYQPGGIPLASSLGDSSEFVGTRDYREGDPVRRIHWPSWARRGGPVVKEYQEEYFSRVALVLDTFLPGDRRPQEEKRLEAAISVVASIAGFFGRTEDVVDILAAGPDVYEVSTGRSLAYLENVLEVLACLEPCRRPPFEIVAPHLHEKLDRLTSVVAVVLDWDERRESFLWGLRDRGVAVSVFLLHEGETARPWAPSAPRIGDVTHLTPAEVARRIAADQGA